MEVKRLVDLQSKDSLTYGKCHKCGSLLEFLSIDECDCSSCGNWYGRNHPDAEPFQLAIKVIIQR